MVFDPAEQELNLYTVTSFVFRQMDSFEKCLELADRREVAVLYASKFSSHPT